MSNSNSSFECIYNLSSDYSFALVGLSVKREKSTFALKFLINQKHTKEKYNEAIITRHTLSNSTKIKLLSIVKFILDLFEFKNKLYSFFMIKILIGYIHNIIFYEFLFKIQYWWRIYINLKSCFLTKFRSNFIIKSSSTITNLDVNHEKSNQLQIEEM